MLSISPLLTDFETLLLQDLWRSSWLLAAMSLVIAAALIVRRHYESRCGRRRLLRRAELERLMWGVLAASVSPSPENVPALGPEDVVLVCDLALDMLRPLRGEDAARIVQLLNAWPVRPHVRRMLARGRRGQRIRMLTLLAHFDDGESLALLQHWAGAADFYVQLAALRSLAARHAVETLPDILAHLIRARRQNTTMLADVLRRFGEPALDMLAALAVGEAQPEVRLAAIAALEALGSLQAVAPLMTLASDPETEIRAQAISALGRLGDPCAEPIVLRALNDRDEAVRVRAAKAAGRLQLRAATPLLAALLADPSWWVRYRAAEALYDMGAIGQSFLQARSRETDRAGETAAQVLAEKEAA